MSDSAKWRHQDLYYSRAKKIRVMAKEEQRLTKPVAVSERSTPCHLSIKEDASGEAVWRRAAGEVGSGRDCHTNKYFLYSKDQDSLKTTGLYRSKVLRLAH
ncbi:uncharacterized protein LOC144050925 [Vanacampus margaritifer]